MGLGSYPELGLSDVRELAREARALNARGIDPIDHRDERNRQTFGYFAEQIAEDKRRLVDSGNLAQGTLTSWWRLLERDVLGRRPFSNTHVSDLTARDFARIIDPIWHERPDRAERLLSACRQVMRRAVAEGAVAANVVDAVGELLPPSIPYVERVRPHPSMPWDDLPDFIASLCPLCNATTEERALVFVTLTAGRSGETRGARWEEFDRARREWRIPDVRMKNRRPHTVPLAEQALAILQLQEDVYEGNDLVFPTGKGGPLASLRGPLVGQPSDQERRSATAHGMRATFKQWGRRTGEEDAILELCLSHDAQTRTERGYNRDPLIDRRREILQRWANYCFSTVPDNHRPERGNDLDNERTR